MSTIRKTSNIQPVVDGQVLVSFVDDAKIGTDGKFGAEWHTVGILNDGSAMALGRAVEKVKTKGWGFGVVAVAGKPGDVTVSCEVLEDNETVQKIAWPSRTADGVLVHDGEIAKCYVAMVETLQNGKTRIRVSREKALASMENMDVKEEVEGKTIEFDVLPDDSKGVFDEIVIDPATTTASTIAPVRFSTPTTTTTTTA